MFLSKGSLPPYNPAKVLNHVLLLILYEFLAFLTKKGRRNYALNAYQM